MSVHRQIIDEIKVYIYIYDDDAIVSNIKYIVLEMLRSLRAQKKKKNQNTHTMSNIIIKSYL